MVGTSAIVVGAALLAARLLIVPSHWLEMKLMLSGFGLAFVALGICTIGL